MRSVVCYIGRKERVRDTRVPEDDRRNDQVQAASLITLVLEPALASIVERTPRVLFSDVWLNDDWIDPFSEPQSS